MLSFFVFFFLEKCVKEGRKQAASVTPLHSPTSIFIHPDFSPVIFGATGAAADAAPSGSGSSAVGDDGVGSASNAACKKEESKRGSKIGLKESGGAK